MDSNWDWDWKIQSSQSNLISSRQSFWPTEAAQTMSNISFQKESSTPANNIKSNAWSESIDDNLTVEKYMNNGILESIASLMYYL